MAMMMACNSDGVLPSLLNKLLNISSLRLISSSRSSSVKTGNIALSLPFLRFQLPGFSEGACVGSNDFENIPMATNRLVLLFVCTTKLREK